MTSIMGEGKVLKTGTRGRVRVRAHRREAMLGEFEKSGDERGEVREACGHPLRNVCQLDPGAEENSIAWAAREEQPLHIVHPREDLARGFPFDGLPAAFQAAALPGPEHRVEALCFVLPGFQPPGRIE